MWCCCPQELLASGANINAEDKLGHTMLWWAVGYQKVGQSVGQAVRRRCPSCLPLICPGVDVCVGGGQGEVHGPEQWRQLIAQLRREGAGLSGSQQAAASGTDPPFPDR